MAELTVGDIRPILTLVASSPFLDDSGTIASQLRSAFTSLGAPLTPELAATFDLIEANPILIATGVAEFRAAIEGLDDATLLSAIPGLGGTTGGTPDETPTDPTPTEPETPVDTTVTTDSNGNDVKTFTLPHSGSTIVVNGDQVTVTLPNGQSENLTGLERLEFSDGTLFLDVADGAGLVKKAYEALLGTSSPDAAGFDFWLNGVEGGTINTFALTEAFSKTDAFTQQYGTLLNDLDALLDAVNLFPNPAKDVVYLNISTVQEMDMVISIVDMMGRDLGVQASIVAGTTSQTVAIPTEDLAAGFYLLHLQGEGLSESLRFHVVK